jgi:hypothetical protein
MQTFIIRDVRLAGWKPGGDVIEVDSGTPAQYIFDCIKTRSKKAGGDLKVIFMCHGLPGFLQCGQGGWSHPSAGNGITVADLTKFDQIKGMVKRIEFYACLVARIGSCPECNGHMGYDGNQFCFMVAQRAATEVKASIHLQYYHDGTVGLWIFRRPDGSGINFGEWNGKVFTWAPNGSISKTEEFPYKD